MASLGGSDGRDVPATTPYQDTPAQAEARAASLQAWREWVAGCEAEFAVLGDPLP